MRADRTTLIGLKIGDSARERKANAAYGVYSRNALLRFDLEGETETIRQHLERAHQIDLETTLSERAPDTMR